MFVSIFEQVLSAFVHGDGNLLNNYPELQEALVWVYFHSNIKEFNKVECWGPLRDTVAPSRGESGTHNYQEMKLKKVSELSDWDLPEPCQEDCNCCFPPMSLIPWSDKLPKQNENGYGTQQSNHQQTQQI